MLRGGAGADLLNGGDGIDTVSHYLVGGGLSINLGSDIGLSGEAEGDKYVLIDNVTGSTSDDSISGNREANVLNGWAGQDALSGAGGADRFVFSAVTDSKVGKADRITDFSHAQGDKIDLSLIDANTGVAGNQAFSFIGNAAYSGVAGQLRFVFDGIDTTVAGDINGDKVSDFHIQLAGAVGSTAADYVL